MKKEIVEIEGKKFTIIFDEKKYKSAQDAIDARNAMEEELKKERFEVKQKNESLIAKSKVDFQKSVDEFEGKIKQLQDEYSEKLKELQKTKPVYVKPELIEVDTTKYQGRGYEGKEPIETEKTLVDFIKDATPDEIAKLKELLK